MKTEDDEPQERTRFQKKQRRKLLGGTSCARKIPFPTPELAALNGQRLLANGRGQTRIYKCKEHYHLTYQV